MSRYFAALALLIASTLCAQEIHLKNRTLRPDRVNDAPEPGAAAGHRIVEFDHSPGVEDLEALIADGHTIVGALPDNAVVVASPAGRVLARQGVRSVSALDPADKISPEFTGTDAVPAIVEFHPDVNADAEDAIASDEGINLTREPFLLPHHALTIAAIDRLRALAAHDEVAYIFPADPDMPGGSGFNACAGMLTIAGAVAQYANIVHGWDLDPDGALHLGYVFGSMTPKVPAATVQSEIVRALNEWSKIANVHFQPGISGSAARTIYVKFASGAHGDAYPFDGPSGVLAHTFYPVPVNAEPIAGDMHLDADENWHAGGDLDIYSVVLHEAGHAIGLGHSDKPGDVMYPYYRGGLHLSPNDIGAAQKLYGLPDGSAAAPPAAITVAPPATGPAATVPSLLHVSVDAHVSTTGSSTVSLSGSATGGTMPFSVQWQTDHGYSGSAQVTGSAWNISSVSLVNGLNTITVTVFDAARQIASETLTVTRATQAANTPPLSVSITAPASNVVAVTTPTLSVAGTSNGTRVTWQTSGGATGTATGSAHWVAPAIPLMIGTNTVIVRAYDDSGHATWCALVAVRHQ